MYDGIRKRRSEKKKKNQMHQNIFQVSPRCFLSTIYISNDIKVILCPETFFFVNKTMAVFAWSLDHRPIIYKFPIREDIEAH